MAEAYLRPQGAGWSADPPTFPAAGSVVRRPQSILAVNSVWLAVVALAFVAASAVRSWRAPQQVEVAALSWPPGLAVGGPTSGSAMWLEDFLLLPAGLLALKGAVLAALALLLPRRPRRLPCFGLALNAGILFWALTTIRWFPIA